MEKEIMETGNDRKLDVRHIRTDLLIIGGGTAGCWAAVKLGKEKDIQVLIAEKANIQRSGCLAAGVNALNAYISKGHVPQDYVEYARKDAQGIVRDDLLLSMSERLNEVTEELEKLGLVILKDENGDYVTRGWRNVKINGENIEPLIAHAAESCENVSVLNHVNITDLKTFEKNGKKRKKAGMRSCRFFSKQSRGLRYRCSGSADSYRRRRRSLSS